MLDQADNSMEPTKLTRAPRRRKQNRVGHVWVDRKRGAWFVRYYTGQSVLNSKGKTVREQVCKRLGGTDPASADYIRSLDIARGKADEITKSASKLKQGNDRVRSDISIGDYVEQYYLPLTKRSCKASTYYGYEKLWRTTLKPKMTRIAVADYSPVDASNLLDGFALAGLGRNSIAHIRALGRGIFALAMTKGVRESNPFVGVKMTEKIKESEATRAYTAWEIGSILKALDESLKAQAAVGLCFFCGLRPGEARGVLWEDYSDGRLYVHQSVWRKTAPTAPKTSTSVQRVAVLKPLQEILSRLWIEEARPTTGYILRGEKGAPLNLDYLARVTIKPLLKLAGLEWHSYYACRRGLATLATEGTGDVMGAAGLLRHKNVSTTSTHYVKVREAATLNAATEVEKLYLEASKDGFIQQAMQQIAPANLQLVESTTRRDA